MENEDVQESDVKTVFFKLTTFLPQIIEPTEDEPEGEYQDLKEIYNKARFGINIEFDIYDFIYDLINYQKVKTGKIIYRNKTLDLSSFWTELEQRNTLMKKWIQENTNSSGVILPYEIKQ